MGLIWLWLNKMVVVCLSGIARCRNRTVSGTCLRAGFEIVSSFMETLLMKKRRK